MQKFLNEKVKFYKCRNVKIKQGINVEIQKSKSTKLFKGRIGEK